MKQGDIIAMDFDPSKGREQKGFRPAVVVSNDAYNQKTDFRVVFPISNTDREYALYVSLDNRTGTTGKILADQLRCIDHRARKCKFIEELPKDILDKIIEIAVATVER
jgi:mRNA interferase MazF